MLAILLLLLQIHTLNDLIEFRIDKEITIREPGKTRMSNLTNKVNISPEVTLFESYNDDICFEMHAGFYYTDYNFICNIFNLSLETSNYSNLQNLIKNHSIIYNQTKRNAVGDNTASEIFEVQHACNLFNLLLKNLVSSCENSCDVNSRFLLDMVLFYSDFCKMLSDDNIISKKSCSFPFNDVFRDLMHGLASIDNNYPSLLPIGKIMDSCMNIYANFQRCCEDLHENIQLGSDSIEEDFYNDQKFDLLKHIGWQFTLLFIEFEDLVSNQNQADSAVFKKTSLLLYYTFGKFRTLMTMFSFLASLRFSTQANSTKVLVDDSLFKYLRSTIVHLTCYASNYDNYLSKMISLKLLGNASTLLKVYDTLCFKTFSSSLENESFFNPSESFDIKFLNKGFRNTFIDKIYKKHVLERIDAIFQPKALSIASLDYFSLGIFKTFFYEDPQNVFFKALMQQFVYENIKSQRYDKIYDFKAIISSFIESIAGKYTLSSTEIPFRYIMLYLKVKSHLNMSRHEFVDEFLSPTNFCLLFQPENASAAKNLKDENKTMSIYVFILLFTIPVSFFLAYKIFKLYKKNY